MTAPLASLNARERAARARLEEMRIALGADPATVRCDALGTWRLMAPCGRVFAADDGGFTIALTRRSYLDWSGLGFCNGHVDGVLRLDRLPTADEAHALARALGLTHRGGSVPRDAA